MLPEEKKPEFIHKVLDRYATVEGEPNTFKFYQMGCATGPDVMRVGELSFCFIASDASNAHDSQAE